MPFKYSAFISYRHIPVYGSEIYKAINTLYQLLSNELRNHIPEPVFYDKVYFKNTPFSDLALAEALYKSVCMIMIYYPLYFTDEVTYTTIEYKAMEELESIRLMGLPKEQRHNGLIIPIALRGKRSLVKIVKRQLIDFSSLFLWSVKDDIKVSFQNEIKTLAKIIASRCEMFKHAQEDLFSNKSNFSLPARGAVLKWLRNSNNNGSDDILV